MQIPALLKSRRFWSAIIGVVVLIVTDLNPELGSTFARLQEEIVLIFGLLIGGYIAEDVVQAWRSGSKDDAKG